MKSGKHSTPICVAIASYGMSGEIFHAPILGNSKFFYLKTVLERSSKKCKARYPLVSIAKKYSEILEDSEIELVVVNTPNALHFPMAKEALLAGKHVVVEKPFTIAVKEGEALIRLAKKKGLMLSVFHNKRYENDFLTVQKIIRENLVGKPVELHWHYDRYRNHLTHKKWKEDDLPGAGVLYDLGVHLIDSTLQLFGMPMTVTAHLRTLRLGAGAPDYFHLRLGYETTDVYLHSSTLVREKGPIVVLHGTNGSFVKYGSDPQEEQSKQGMTPLDKGWALEPSSQQGLLHNETARVPFPSAKGGYEKFYEGFYYAIREKTTVPVLPEQALNNIRIIELAMQSHVAQRTIVL